jgi:hypothetical protein
MRFGATKTFVACNELHPEQGTETNAYVATYNHLGEHLPVTEGLASRGGLALIRVESSFIRGPTPRRVA